MVWWKYINNSELIRKLKGIIRTQNVRDRWYCFESHDMKWTRRGGTIKAGSTNIHGSQNRK